VVCTTKLVPRTCEWLLGDFASEWLSDGDWAVCVQYGGLRLYVRRYLFY